MTLDLDSQDGRSRVISIVPRASSDNAKARDDGEKDPV